MINLFIIEIYKLFKSKIFWIIFIMSTIFGVAMAPDHHTFLTGYERIGVSFYYACLLMIFPILLGAISFGNDFTQRTINNLICSGHTRFQIFASKVLSYFIGVNIIVLFSPIINVVINTMLNRYNSGFFINEGEILAKTILATSLLGMAMSSVSIFFAQVFKDIGKTVGISVVVFFLNITSLNSFNDIRESLFRFLPLGQARLILYRPLLENAFKEAMLVGIITIVFLLNVSYLIFKKSELK